VLTCSCKVIGSKMSKEDYQNKVLHCLLIKFEQRSS